MSIAEERIRNIQKKRNKKQKTFLSKGLGKISKLLAVAVLIHYILVLFQGDYHPMINSAREWIITYIYNGPLAGLVQPACAKIWGLQTATFYGQQGRISRTVRAILNGQPGISAGQRVLRPTDQY